MHRKGFERRMHRFVNSNAYTVSRHDDIEAGKRLWIVHVNKPAPLIRWGALIGDCLFNFRSALDQLAFDLAVANRKGQLTEKEKMDSEFPIFHRRAPTKRDLDRKIGAVHPKARKLIEGMQPYGRKDRAALKYLDLLHNFDKHRTLHLVVGTSIAVSYVGDMDFEFINLRPFKHGDVLARVPLASDPKRNQDPSFGFAVAFSETGPGAAAPDVTTTLSWIGQHIEKGVIPDLLPYL
ncbi:MAG: hypothetical protein AABM66_07480 [Actinomycetota bacterium]